MNSLSRMLGLGLALLLVFLAAALAAQGWLNRETQRLRAEAVTAKRQQVEAALRLLPRPAPAWDDAFGAELGALTGSTVLFHDAGTPPPDLNQAGALSFDYQPPGSPRHARIYFPLTGLARLTVLHHRLLLAITLLALLLLVGPALVFVSRRPAAPGATTPPFPTSADLKGLEHFARISVERGEILAREFDARQRAEEDLRLSRTQLEQSLEERIRLGRDLHDNLSQSLYGLSLTLEGTAKRLPADAAPELRERLALAVTELRRLNQEVRAFIRELEPDRVHGQPLAAALTGLLASLPPSDDLTIERRIDDEALAALPADRSAGIVNILREALSNSLRHGGATHLGVHALRDADSVVFAVHDNGRGFDPATGRPGGRGLANMQARATALGGELRLVSAPGKGTRVLLTLPVASAT